MRASASAAVRVRRLAQLPGQADLAERGERPAPPVAERTRAADATASAIARSAPGSSTRTPPATDTKTSLAAEAHAAVARQDREDQREPVAVDAVGHAPRRHELGWAHTSAWTSTSSGREPSIAQSTTDPGARVASATKRAEASSTSTSPLVAHLEDADLVGRPEAVLERAERAVGALALALELEDAVHEVLEHARPGERALLGHVAHEQHRDAALLGDAHQPAGDLADLAHRAGRAGQRRA